MGFQNDLDTQSFSNSRYTSLTKWSGFPRSQALRKAEHTSVAAWQAGVGAESSAKMNSWMNVDELSPVAMLAANRSLALRPNPPEQSNNKKCTRFHNTYVLKYLKELAHQLRCLTRIRSRWLVYPMGAHDHEAGRGIALWFGASVNTEYLLCVLKALSSTIRGCANYACRRFEKSTSASVVV